MNLKKRVKLIIWLVIFIAIGYLGYSNYNNIVKKYNQIFNKSDNVEPVIKKEKKPKEKIYKLSLIAAGDGLLHGSVYKDAYNGSEYDFTKQLDLIKPIVSKYDLAFYNQETIFGGKELGFSSYPRFNCPSEFGDAAIDAGFNMVSLANNHTLDKGEKGILNAVKYWKTKDVLFSGASDSEEYRNQENIIEKNNITYTMLAYTTLTNGLRVPNGKDYLVNVYNKEQVLADIERVRNKVDILMVSMHWGTEYTHNPTTEQIEIANYLASLGVDIVIGHHPHVIQPITKINNTIIIYSLGNFISAQNGIEKLVGAMVNLDITKKTRSGNSEIIIDNLGADLIYTYRDLRYRNVKVVPFSVMEDKYLSNNQAVYDKYKDILLKMDNTIQVKDLKSEINNILE